MECPKKHDIGVMTITFENTFLELWERFYGKIGTTFVFWDSSKDWNTLRRVRMIEEKVKELLKTFKYVVFTDPDEFVVGDWTGLERPYYVTRGFDIIQTVGEKEIDLNSPILEQRNWWIESQWYRKPCVTRVPLALNVGCHTKEESDGKFTLLHLGRVDYALKEALNRERRRKRIEHGANKNLSIQIGVSDEIFRDWYYSDFERVERIPESMKGLL